MENTKQIQPTLVIDQYQTIIHKYLLYKWVRQPQGVIYVGVSSDGINGVAECAVMGKGQYGFQQGDVIMVESCEGALDAYYKHCAVMEESKPVLNKEPLQDPTDKLLFCPFPACGKQFIKNRKWQEYCTEDCRKMHGKAKNKRAKASNAIKCWNPSCADGFERTDAEIAANLCFCPKCRTLFDSNKILIK